MINNNLMHTTEQKIQTTATHLVEAGIGESPPILLKPRKKTARYLRIREFPKCVTPSLCATKSRTNARLHTLSLSKSSGGPDKFGRKLDINHQMPKVGNGRFGGNRANTGRDIYGEARFLANTRFWTQRAIAIDRAAAVA